MTRAAAPHRFTYVATRRACYTGFVTQAIVNNLAPLLFIVFQSRYQVPVEQLGALVLLNFGVQLLTDFAAVKFVDRLGYRRPLVLAHVLAVLGLVLLAFAPEVAPTPYVGLCIAISVYAVGGGLLEVLVSPVVDALPSPQEGKAAAMSLLHSFYCWGQVAVVVGTTALLAQTGFGSWKVLPLLWALVPAANLVLFLRVPLPDTVPDEHRSPLRSLFSAPAFVAALVLMMTAGAAELTMSQWSSFFAEDALGVAKVWGDLAGPGLFAVLMGIGRIVYGLWGERIPLLPTMIGSGALAVVCYLVATLSPLPVVSLVACAVCGIAVAVLWPGTFSLAAARFPLGGAAMFGVLAVMGDAGGALGPWLTGVVAEVSTQSAGFLGAIRAWLPEDGGSGLRTGLLLATVFPAVLVVCASVYAVGVRRRPRGDGLRDDNVGRRTGCTQP